MTTTDIVRATFDGLAELITAGEDCWRAQEQLDSLCAPDAPRALEAITAVAAAFIEALREHMPDRPWSLFDLDELIVDLPPTMTVEDRARFGALAYANSHARWLTLPRVDFDLDDVATARDACRTLAQVALAAAGILDNEQENAEDAKRIVEKALWRAAGRTHLAFRPS